MKHIIVMGGSNSVTSINKQLAIYASTLLQPADVQVIDLNNYDLPLFSVQAQQHQGIPSEVYALIALFEQADGLIISTSEHNRSITAALKNTLDWCSRAKIDFLVNTPTLLMSTSPGGYGGQNARNAAEAILPMFKADIVSTFSLPSFNANFSDAKITDATLKESLKGAVAIFETAVYA